MSGNEIMKYDNKIIIVLASYNPDYDTYIIVAYGVPLASIHLMLFPCQVTEDTANLMKNTFRIEERGLVFVKGKGELKTFFVGDEWRGQRI